MIKKLLTCLFLLLISVYIVMALTVLNRKPQGAVCEEVACIIQDSIESSFIQPQEVEEILKSKKLYPKGKIMDSVACREIEACLLEDSRIEKAECYKSPANRICIEIVQRVPLLRVMPNNGKNYIVDIKGRVMPDARSTAYLPIVTGYADEHIACNELFEFAKFLQKDKFWDAQILQINVTKDKEIELVPRVGNHIIFLGKPEQYEEKLARLKMFYEKALSKVGWNKYSRISVEFNNQIICTK